jgi:alpha-galactosidase
MLFTKMSNLAFSTSNAIDTVKLYDIGLKKLNKYAPAKTVKGQYPSLGRKPHLNGYMTIANSSMVYSLKGQALRLKGKVGIDDIVAKKFTESVEVLVYVDNRRIWSSGPLKSGKLPVSIDIDLKGINELEVISDFAGDQYDYAQVTFADMVISYSGFRPEPIYPRKVKIDSTKIFIKPEGPKTPRITGGRVFWVRPG